MPDRANSVDDVPSWQSVSLGELCITGPAPSEEATLIQQFRSSRAMDCPANPAANEQRGVRGVDDRVDSERRDVSSNGSKRGGHSEGSEKRISNVVVLSCQCFTHHFSTISALVLSTNASTSRRSSSGT